MLGNAESFLSCVRRNPVNDEILRRLPLLRLNQCFLAAGCLFQAVWNLRSGRPPAENVKDYDVFYFDDRDLSAGAEDLVNERACDLFRDLGVQLEFKNQARVHLWYPEYFGGSYWPLSSSTDGIRRYVVECTCVGIDSSTGELFAPVVLADLWDGMLRINPLMSQRPDLFRAKAQSYKSRWPWLTIVDTGSDS